MRLCALYVSVHAHVPFSAVFLSSALSRWVCVCVCDGFAINRSVRSNYWQCLLWRERSRFTTGESHDQVMVTTVRIFVFSPFWSLWGSNSRRHGTPSLHSVSPNFFRSTARITYSIGLDKLLLFFQDWRWHYPNFQLEISQILLCVYVWVCVYLVSWFLQIFCRFTWLLQKFLGPRGGTYNLFTVLQSLWVVLQDVTDMVVQSKLIISNNLRYDGPWVVA